MTLHGYYDANEHFPPVNTYDKDGKSLFSWRVESLRMMDYLFYALLKKDEPWNSPHNIKLLGKLTIPEYHMPK